MSQKVIVQIPATRQVQRNILEPIHFTKAERGILPILDFKCPNQSLQMSKFPMVSNCIPETSNTWHMWTSKMPISFSLTNSSVLPALRISKPLLPVSCTGLQLIFCSQSVHTGFNTPACPAQDLGPSSHRRLRPSSEGLPSILVIRKCPILSAGW